MKKLLKYYKNLSSAVKASIWFTICSVLQKGIQFITIPFFTRLLTTEQYGQFSLYQSWLSVITIFATLNLAAGVFNNGMLKYENDRPRYISSMQGLSTVATLVVAVIYLLFKQWWDKVIGLPDIVMLAMFLELLFSPALSFWAAKQRFEYKYAALVGVTLGVSVLGPIIGIGAVLSTEHRGVARILSVALVNAIVGLLFYLFNAIRGKTFFQKTYWRFALRFNLPLIPHYLSTIVLGQADRIMIGWYCGESEVAIYSLAYSIAWVMNIITTSINASFIPWTYQKCAKKDFSAIGRVSRYLLLLVAGITLIPTLLAPEIIAIMGSQEYSAGMWLIPPVAISTFLTFLYTLFANIEFFFEESKFVMIASVLGAALNIVLNILFIPSLGYSAAAYTTLICYLAFSLAHYLFMRKICRKRNVEQAIYPMREIVVLTVVLIFVSEALLLTYPLPVLRYGIIVLLGGLVFVKRKVLFEKLAELKSGEE